MTARLSTGKKPNVPKLMPQQKTNIPPKRPHHSHFSMFPTRATYFRSLQMARVKQCQK